MSLTEQSAIDRIEILDNGVIQVRRVDKIIKDGIEMSKVFHRHCLVPGQDLAEQDDRVVALANAAWTPDIIKAWSGS